MSQKPKSDPLDQKLRDVLIPGHVIELDQDEAEALGAFQEKALTEEDAWESVSDESV